MKYELGQEVEVSFIGKIIRVECFGDKILYSVNIADNQRAWARDLTETQIYPLNKGEENDTGK